MNICRKMNKGAAVILPFGLIVDQKKFVITFRS